jgi:hypothetical protein
MPATNIFAGMARSYAIGMSVVSNVNWNYTLSGTYANYKIRIVGFQPDLQGVAHKYHQE